MNGAGGGAARFALHLAPRQARLVAEALGLRPYAQVQALMARIQAWAREWRADGDTGLVLDAGELALIVAALSDLPYRRVHVLVRGLEAQLAALRAQAGRLERAA